MVQERDNDSSSSVKIMRSRLAHYVAWYRLIVVQSSFGLAMFTWHVTPLLAQPLPSSRAAVCVASTTDALQAMPDTSQITGVVVRFTSSPTGRTSDAHLAKALSVLTADQLQSLIEAPVRSRYDVSPRQEVGAMSNAVAEGRVLGLRWVVTGRVERTGDSVLVSWDLLDSFTGNKSGSGTSRSRFVQLESMSSALSSEIARTIGSAGALPALRQGSTTAPSLAAFELYLAGLYRHDSFIPSEQRDAVVQLNHAVQLDPTLQSAWVALAEANARLVEWGEGGSAFGRSERSASALTAANRSLALSPRDARTLAVLAHVHLLRDEPIAASQVIDGLRRMAPTSDDLSWLTMELALVHGDARATRTAMESNVPQQARSPRALYLRAEHARRTNNLVDACQSLNRLLVLEPSWAPAYVQRALVRTSLGDRRGGWQDAEMATRLGQPVWGNMVSALIDYSVSDSVRTRARLRRLSVIEPETVLPTLDVLLRAAVRQASGQTDRALRVLSVAPCDDPHRRYLSSDPLLQGLKVPTDCRSSGRTSLLTSARGK